MVFFLENKFLAGLDLAAYDANAIGRRLTMESAEVAACVSPERMYRMKSSGYGWVTGRTEDGRSAIAVCPDKVFLFLFDRDGRMSETVLVDDEEGEDWT